MLLFVCLPPELNRSADVSVYVSRHRPVKVVLRTLIIMSLCIGNELFLTQHVQ